MAFITNDGRVHHIPVRRPMHLYFGVFGHWKPISTEGMRLVFLGFMENLLRGSAWNQYRHQITSHIAIPYPEERQMCIISAPSSPSRSYPLFLELVCHGEVPEYTSVLMDWEHLSQKQSACVRKVTARRNVEAHSRQPRPREQLLLEIQEFIFLHGMELNSVPVSPPLWELFPLF